MLLLMRCQTNFYEFRFNQQLQQQLECIQLMPDCHGWWISKMQSGREDTLEERYAIKFCFKHRKMPQKRMECFRLFWSILHESSISFWVAWDIQGRQGFCEGWWEVWEELIGQIKNFMDKDRRVSIETISAQFDVSVGTVHTIFLKELKMRKICAKFVPRVHREDQKERRCHDSREMVDLINADSAVLDALVTCDERWIYCYDPETKRQSSQWKHAGPPRPKKARQSKSTQKPLMILFLIYMHCVTTGQTVN